MMHGHDGRRGAKQAGHEQCPIWKKMDITYGDLGGFRDSGGGPGQHRPCGVLGIDGSDLPRGTVLIFVCGVVIRQAEAIASAGKESQ